MKFTNVKLIETILLYWTDPNKLVDLLFLISKLIKKYGKMLFTQKYTKELGMIDKDLWYTIKILSVTKKTNYDDVKRLIALIKKTSPDYFLSFSVNSDSDEHNKLIEKHIKDKFKKSDIKLENSSNFWLDVSWEWRYYKKSLDSDLQKILWK